MCHLNFSILAFSANFCPIKNDLSGNTVWQQASGFQKVANLAIFGIFLLFRFWWVFFCFRNHPILLQITRQPRIGMQSGWQYSPMLLWRKLLQLCKLIFIQCQFYGELISALFPAKLIKKEKVKRWSSTKKKIIFELNSHSWWWSRESTKNAEFWPKSQQFFDKQNWQIHLCEAVTKMFAFLMFA